MRLGMLSRAVWRLASVSICIVDQPRKVFESFATDSCLRLWLLRDGSLREDRRRRERRTDSRRSQTDLGQPLKCQGQALRADTSALRADPVAATIQTPRKVRCIGGIPSLVICAAAVLGLALGSGLAATPPARAETLSSAEIAKLPEMVEWAYRNSPVEDPVPCAAVCNHLWEVEQGPILLGSAEKALWDQLGTFETSASLWPPLSELSSGLGEQNLGTSPFQVGWHLRGANAKWLEFSEEPAPEASSVHVLRIQRTLFRAAAGSGESIRTTLGPGLRTRMDLCG